MAERCSKMLPSFNAPDHQCHNRGRYLHDGKPYCLLHHPEKQTWREARNTACVNAFHSPTRTIATENIPEGLVWKLIDHLERSQEKLQTLIRELSDPGPDSNAVVYCNHQLLSSLKIEEDQ